ncbi:hypothetical protein PSPO01_09199 [Paraphaeosphaeria sporulosa]
MVCLYGRLDITTINLFSKLGTLPLSNHLHIPFRKSTNPLNTIAAQELQGSSGFAVLSCSRIPTYAPRRSRLSHSAPFLFRYLSCVENVQCAAKIPKKPITFLVHLSLTLTLRNNTKRENQQKNCIFRESNPSQSLSDNQS